MLVPAAAATQARRMAEASLTQAAQSTLAAATRVRAAAVQVEGAEVEDLAEVLRLSAPG